MSYLLPSSDFFLWSNNASFVSFENPFQYVSFGMFVVIVVAVTVVGTTFYRRMMFQRTIFRTVENLITGRVSTRPSRSGGSSRPINNSFQNFQLYAMLTVAGLLLFAFLKPDKPTNRNTDYTHYTNHQVDNTEQRQQRNKPEVKRFYNESPKRKPQENQAVLQVAQKNELRPTGNHDRHEQFIDTRNNDRTFEAERGLKFSIQISSGGVEKFLMARGKKIASMGLGQRVYLYPLGTKIKLLFGTYDSREGAKKALAGYRAETGDQEAFITQLSEGADDNLYIVPG